MQSLSVLLKQLCILCVVFLTLFLTPLQGMGQNNHLQYNHSSNGWGQRFGDTGSDFGNDVATDASGNVYLTGSFQESVNFGGGTLTSAGAEDIFLAKFDRNGNALWSKRFGGDSPDIGSSSASDSGDSVAIDPAGNVYLTGRFTEEVNFGTGDLINTEYGSDIFLAKFDPNGNAIWAKQFGSYGPDYGTGLAIDPIGSIYLTGFVMHDANFGGSHIPDRYDNTFLAKFDLDGNHLWSKLFSQTGTSLSKDIEVDVNGNVLLTGWFSNRIDFGGGEMGEDLTSDNAFLVKFDKNGSHLWSKMYSNYSDVHANGLASDSKGNVYFTGYFWDTLNFGGDPITSRGSRDIFLVKLSPQGNHLWSKNFGESPSLEGSSYSYALEVDAFDHLFLTGAYIGNLDLGGVVLDWIGHMDIFLAEFDSNGNHLWSRSFGGSGEEYGYSLAVHTSGTVFLIGYFDGSVDFGDGLLTSKGRDVYLAKLDFHKMYLPIIHR